MIPTQGESNKNTAQYTGRDNDNTGLYYYRARYYAPELKRFISSDPIGLSGGLNTYEYVGGDPLNATDPSGQIAMVIPIGINYGRCVLMCVAMEMIMDPCQTMGEAAQTCALECLNPMNWGGKGAAGKMAAKSSSAARREAMRKAGTPTSRSATSQSGKEGQRQTTTEGADGKPRVQTQHPADQAHPQPHWHDAAPKIDSATGEIRINNQGQIKYQNGGTTETY